MRTLRMALVLMVGVTATIQGTALAYHMREWNHDHSLLPYRPQGLSELRREFGSACNGEANDARTWFPSAVARNQGGYVNYHARLAGAVGSNIRNHLSADHRDGAVDFGVYGYDCRPKRGSSDWSVHAWGAAVDTNTARNPRGQTYWNGRGADGVDYGTYIPHVWCCSYPGHRFFWGLRFDGTKDPHHFQYVTGY